MVGCNGSGFASAPSKVVLEGDMMEVMELLYLLHRG